MAHEFLSSSRLKFPINSLRRFSSLLDQLFVSGGNFLTVAICAHSLTLSEQGKFTFVFASYMALLLLNVAAIFQGATVRAPSRAHQSYEICLARLQLVHALCASLLVSSVWFSVGATLSWQVTTPEAALLFGFLVLQQLADFDRRAAYVFSGTRRAVFSSAVTYIPRVVALFLIKPTNISQVLLVLVLSSLIPSLLTLVTVLNRRSGNSISWIKEAKAHLAYSRLFIAGAPLGWLWTYIPLLMLGVMHSKEQAALLGSIRGISNIANFLMEQIETKVVADWARMHHVEGRLSIDGAVSRLLKTGMAFWLLAMTVIVTFGSQIVALVLGNLYASHWHLLIVGWIGYGIYFASRVVGLKHRTLGSNHVEFIGNLCGVLTALAAGFVLIPEFDAMGGAWVYVLVALIMFGSQILALKGGKMFAK